MTPSRLAFFQRTAVGRKTWVGQAQSFRAAFGPTLPFGTGQRATALLRYFRRRSRLWCCRST